MTAQATGLGKALRLATLFLAGFACTSVHAQGMVGHNAGQVHQVHQGHRCADHCRQPLPHARRRNVLRLPADRRRSERRSPDVQHQQAPALGHLRSEHRSPARHARRRATSARSRASRFPSADGKSRKSLGKFSIKVVAGMPPTISGTPGTTVTEGQAYAFQPTAADSDLQSLRYAHHQQADLGSVRRSDRSPVRHPAEGQCGCIRQCRNLGDRRREHRQPRFVHYHRCRSSQRGAADRGYAVGLGPGRPGL